MRLMLIRLRRWITVGNIVCLFGPAILMTIIIDLYKSNLLNSNDIFILFLLLLISIGTTLAISNLGRRGINWIQGTALIGSTAAVFAACGHISSLPHSENLINNFNVLLNKVGITSLNEQWGLFVIFVLLTFLVSAYIYILNTFEVGVRNSANEELRRALNQRIYHISNELDWSIISRKDSSKKEIDRFTPLDVSIEKKEGNKKKKYSDLMKCIRKNRKKGRIFLLKGDPGSGKSVALRKLSVELSNSNGALPIYIDLKKWKDGWEIEGWKKEDKEERIQRFVIDSIENEIMEFDNRQLIMEHFLKQISERKCFFLIDAFDEMPCFLGKQNPEPLISDISKFLYYFMITNGQGGIVASREYHSPSSEIGADIVLWIQEFDELRIRKMIFRYLPKAGKTVWEKLIKREDMLAICRNPFHLTLLINYLMDSIDEFPEKQMDLYEGFIKHGLKSVGKLVSVETDVAIEKGTEIAVFLQDTQQNECSLSSLPESILQYPNIISALEKTRICRLGGEDEPCLTFSHRRFQEYFLVRNMIKCQTEWSKVQNSISGYTDLRDAYVLYCEVADSCIVSSIAAFCWKTVLDNFTLGEDGWNRDSLVNTLFFMADAFRRRRDAMIVCTENFENEIMSMIEKTDDFVVRLALVNCMVLFRQKNLQKYVLNIFDLGNRWYEDAVMNNCRKIQKLEPEVESAFYSYFQRMTYMSFFRRFHNIHFALSISKYFKTVRIRHSILAIKYICELFLFFSIIAVGNIIRILPPEVYDALKNRYFTHFTDGFWFWLFDIIIKGTIPLTKLFKIDFSISNYLDLVLVLICFAIMLIISGDVLRHSAKKLLEIFYKTYLPYEIGTLTISFVFFLCLYENIRIGTLDILSFYTVLLCIIVVITIFDNFRDKEYIRFNSRWVVWEPYELLMAVSFVTLFIFIGYSEIEVVSYGFRFIIVTLSIIAFIEGFFGLYLLIKYLLLRRADAKLISEIIDLLNRDDEPFVDRMKIAKMLKELKTEQGKIKYTELLVDKHVKLQGSWPEDFYLDDEEEVVLHNIAVLDWKGKPVGKRIS